jgi:hypothetical protein
MLSAHRHTMASPAVLVCLICLTLTGCASSTFITKRGTDIRWDGPIASGDAARFAKLLTPDTRRLVIRSVGGEAAESFRVSQLIQEHQLSVLVHGYCASACASILFVAAGEREVEEDAYLAFHASQDELISRMASAEIAKRTNLPEADLLASMDKIDAQFKELFHRMGVDEELNERLGRMAAFVPGTAVVTAVENQGGSKETVQLYAKRCGYLSWIPGEEELAQAGIKLARPYVRADKEKIAKAMHMKVQDIYFGAIADVVPPSCEKDKDT